MPRACALDDRFSIATIGDPETPASPIGKQASLGAARDARHSSGAGGTNGMSDALALSRQGRVRPSSDRYGTVITRLQPLSFSSNGPSLVTFTRAVQLIPA